MATLCGDVIQCGREQPRRNRAVSTTSNRPLPALRLIAADDDSVARAFLRALTKDLELDVDVVEDGVQVLRLLERGTRPAILLLDWVMPGLSGLDVCRRVRAVSEVPTYTIIATGKHPDRLYRALDAGADDLMAKPFERKELLTRLQVARYALDAAPGRSLRSAVEEARRSDGGEVVFRGAGKVTRIYFQHGQVVWVSVAPGAGHPGEALRVSLGIEAADLRAVVQESRVTGKPFDTLLVDWGLCDRSALHDALAEHFFSLLAPAEQLASSRATFIPNSAARSQTEMRFDIDDLAPWMAVPDPSCTSAPPPRAEDEESALRGLGSSIRQIDGVEAWFVLDPRDGTCLRSRGDESLVETAWALTRTLSDVGQESGPNHWKELIVTTERHFLLARGSKNGPVVVCALQRDGARLGLARHRLNQILLDGILLQT